MIAGTKILGGKDVSQDTISCWKQSVCYLIPSSVWKNSRLEKRVTNQIVNLKSKIVNNFIVNLKSTIVNNII